MHPTYKQATIPGEFVEGSILILSLVSVVHMIFGCLQYPVQFESMGRQGHTHLKTSYEL